MPALLLRNRWILVPVMLLTSAIAFAVITVALAVADYPLGVEPRYDSRAASFEQERLQHRENDRLRWIVTPTLSRLDASLLGVQLHIEDKHANYIDGARIEVECIPIANADQRQTVELTAVGAGNYTGSSVIAQEGAFEFRVTVIKGADQYTDLIRRSIPAATP